MFVWLHLLSIPLFVGAELLACSLPFRVDGITTRLECEGPHAVDKAIDEFLSSTSKIVSCDSCESRTARGILEERSAVARWPNISLEPTHPLARDGSGVLIVTSSDRLELANATWHTWAAYASTNGYGFLPLEMGSQPFRSAHWNKLWLLHSLAEENRYDSIVVVDDDIVVTSSAPFDFLANDEDTLVAMADPLLLGNDHASQPTQFNSGLLATKRPSARVRSLLEYAWLEPLRSETCWLKECPFWDQSALVRLVNLPQSKFKDTVKILPYRSLQSFWNAHVCALDWIDPDCDLGLRHLAWRPGDFAAHISGGSLQNRLGRLDLLLNDDEIGRAETADFATHRQILIDNLLASGVCSTQDAAGTIVESSGHSYSDVCSHIRYVDDGFGAKRRIVLENAILMRTNRLEELVLSAYNTSFGESASNAYNHRLKELRDANLLA